MLLTNQICMTPPINLHPNEYSQEYYYFPLVVRLDRCVVSCNPLAFKLDRCVGTCNALVDLSNKVCVLNKIEDLNLSMFNMKWI